MTQESTEEEKEKLPQEFVRDVFVYPTSASIFFFQFEAEVGAPYSVVAPGEQTARQYIRNVYDAEGDEEIIRVCLIDRATGELMPAPKWVR
jgi:hypothetical protein